ncbi:UBX domain-containing protein 1 [Cladobotryum mycophilum]|uniref:UBX domain-containing protein 1 n=1 Tax=Cladobotryum mycophilum TaxID=491253 RepID=A0ABR0SNQ7_9HYPO
MAGDKEPEDHDTMVRDFCNMSNTTPEIALQYLEGNNWVMLDACNSFFHDEDEAALEERTRKAAEGTLEQYDGPRTLDGRPAPRGDFRPPRPPQKKKGVTTLGTLGSGSGSGAHGDDDEDDEGDYSDEEEESERRNLFAGGEKSGLAVQDPKQQEGGPRKIISDILAKARANAARGDTGSEAGPSRPTHFRGEGVTLGGEGVESRTIPDPLGAARAAPGPPEERVLHIWQDGFSIDDGELRRFDDPANEMDLKMIRSGRAPLHLMNVGHDQAVDVKLHQHDTPYKPSPQKYKPFAGSGHRLGSPVPGAGPSTPATPAAPAPAAATAAASSSTSAATPNVDNSQPTLALRIQMPDGTRLPARFNTTHTIGDVYGFVQGASPETRTRAWVLATTFPNKEHTDKSLALGDVPEFKKGGIAVVKWS